MEKITGYRLEALPFEGLQRISNLIEFEGPILSHYKDIYNHDYLYYWVDQNDKFNRWLIWKVQEDLLHLFLLKEISLDSLFPKSGENIFTVDIDGYANYVDITISYVDLIPEAYRPEPDMYFKFETPSVYKDQLKVRSYLSELKERAIYFNLEPSSSRYDVTVGVKDVWDALENVGKSLVAFVDFRIREILSTRIANQERVQAAAASLSSSNRFRVVYLNLNSFHIGIAADMIQTSDKVIDPSIQAFQKDVLSIYQNEVLDNDFSSTQDINILIEKYPDEEVRKKIFEPIVKIINNDNIKLNITDYSKAFDKTYKRVPKAEKVALTPPRTKVSTKDNPEHAIIVAYLFADKNPEQGTLFPKDITGRLLYSKETTTFPFELDRITLPTGEVKIFSRTIELEGSFEGGTFVLIYDPLGIAVSGQSIKQIEDRFHTELVSLYLASLNDDNRYSDFIKSLIPE